MALMAISDNRTGFEAKGEASGIWSHRSPGVRARG
jgi:hypothetical protein